MFLHVSTTKQQHVLVTTPFRSRFSDQKSHPAPLYRRQETAGGGREPRLYYPPRGHQSSGWPMKSMSRRHWENVPNQDLTIENAEVSSRLVMIHHQTYRVSFTNIMISACIILGDWKLTNHPEMRGLTSPVNGYRLIGWHRSLKKVRFAA